ncbi:TPA: glutamate-cysteine ligase family protein [Streptococcus suis]|uniref:glutamate-cysteine ligase family protein n=1 Tax=Streptococcus suis TaxID=1307 RepID=UPI002FC73B75
MNREDMTSLGNCFEEYYFANIKEKPELFIGVELEYPIVNISGKATSIQVATDMMRHISNQNGFTIVKRDDRGNPIELQHELGDLILFEVTYNTLEFAFAKAKNIGSVEERHKEYLENIQYYLRQNGHELQGLGINPNWENNDNRPVDTGRYRMLMNYLKLGEGKPNMHPYTGYAGFICGNQVQFDVSRKSFLRVINAFNKIEAAKAFLFANSPFDQIDDMALTRDYFWEYSMHGLLKNNVGIYSEEFRSEAEYCQYQEESAMFYVIRDNCYYYFKPITVKSFFEQEKFAAYSEAGEICYFVPKADDFKNHRSYHYQELTKRGIIEFRSTCTQPFETTFAPIAFHLGLLANLVKLEEILESTEFFKEFGRNYSKLRRQFSRKKLSDLEQRMVKDFSKTLLDCAHEALLLRGYSEEKYLTPLYNSLIDDFGVL